MLTIIDCKGKMTRIPVPAEEDQLDVLQAAVGGYVAVIELRSGKQMWCNEEGSLLGLPHNPTASIIARTPICGVVVLADKGDIK